MVFLNEFSDVYVLQFIYCNLGTHVERTECNTELCSTWLNWGSWTSCPDTCYSSSSHRKRLCVAGGASSSACPGDSIEWRLCPKTSCPYTSTTTKQGMFQIHIEIYMTGAEH